MAQSDVIGGKWLKVAETGIAEYMAALGSEAPPNARIVLQWLTATTATIGHWIQIMQINEVSRGQVFKLGEEFEHESFDGSTAKSTITVDGTVMTQIQIHNGKEMRVVREFNGDKMSTKFTLAGSDIVATNDFERVKKCEFHLE